MKSFFKERFELISLLVCGLIIVQIINFLTNGYIMRFGLIPRDFSHIFGIIFSPFIHSNWQHLFSNLPPFIILSLFLLKNSIKNYILACIFIILFSGVLLWFFGRGAVHIGASGLIFGLWAFLLVQGFFSKNLIDILVSIIVFIYFGALAYGLLPSNSSISTEGHIFGALAGVLYGYLSNKK